MRKNLFYLLLIGLLSFGCKSVTPEEVKDTKHYLLGDVKPYMKSIAAGTIKDSDFNNLSNYLKENFNIDIYETQYLTVSYLKPKSMCWYNNYANISKERGMKFIDKLKEQSNSQLLFLHSDKGHSESWSNIDPEKYFYNLFPDAKGSDFCDFTITLSVSKNFFLKKGHFDISVANAFKNELEKFDASNQFP